MEPRAVTIRSGTFRCELYMTPALGNMNLTNWRKLLRLAVRDWYHPEDNNKAMREIRLWLPELVREADRERETAEKIFKSCRRPKRGDPETISDLYDSKKWAAQAARAKYKGLSKMLSVFIEETQNYVF